MAGSPGQLLLVGAGGFVGSIMRYALGGVVHKAREQGLAGATVLRGLASARTAGFTPRRS